MYVCHEPGTEIEQLQQALNEAKSSEDQREQKCKELKTTVVQNEATIRQLTADIRAMRNWKAAKMKLLKKAIQTSMEQQ